MALPRYQFALMDRTKTDDFGYHHIIASAKSEQELAHQHARILGDPNNQHDFNDLYAGVASTGDRNAYTPFAINKEQQADYLIALAAALQEERDTPSANRDVLKNALDAVGRTARDITGDEEQRVPLLERNGRKYYYAHQENGAPPINDLNLVAKNGKIVVGNELQTPITGIISDSSHYFTGSTNNTATPQGITPRAIAGFGAIIPAQHETRIRADTGATESKAHITTPRIVILENNDVILVGPKGLAQGLNFINAQKPLVDLDLSARAPSRPTYCSNTPIDIVL